jgi:hypothetical protein
MSTLIWFVSSIYACTALWYFANGKSWDRLCAYQGWFDLHNAVTAISVLALGGVAMFGAISMNAGAWSQDRADSLTCIVFMIGSFLWIGVIVAIRLNRTEGEVKRVVKPWEAPLPQSLRELVSYVHAPDGWEPFSRAFLDGFYSADQDGKQAMIGDEPPLTDDEYLNAFVAGMAEHLAASYGLKVPAWSWNSRSRFLRKPVFPCNLEGLKAYLLSSTPSAFRRRLIFTGDNPLYRPLKDYKNSLFEGVE